MDLVEDCTCSFKGFIQMRRLNIENFNTSSEYEMIFEDRRENRPQPMDVLRWEQLFKNFQGGKLIDLGCLDSLIPIWAKEKFPKSEIWGLDQAEEAIKKLQEERPDIFYTTGDVYNTTLPDNYFDYVIAGELIEHLERPEEFIKEAFRILKPGGTLALSTPKEEKLGEVDGHRHLWSFHRNDVKWMLEPYSSKVKIGEIPSWLRRRIKYHHPYIIAWATKR